MPMMFHVDIFRCNFPNTPYLSSAHNTVRSQARQCGLSTVVCLPMFHLLILTIKLTCIGNNCLICKMLSGMGLTASRLLDCSSCNWFETQSCNRFVTVTQTLVTLTVVNNAIDLTLLKLPLSPLPPLNCHNLAWTANKNTNCFMCIILYNFKW
jgi:hypothetical protein